MKPDRPIGDGGDREESGGADRPGPTGSPKAELTPERRAALARKGAILYAKSCGTEGPTSCAEGFATGQLRLGNEQVVRDYLEFLEGRIAALESNDPDGLSARTAALIGKIRGHLGGQ